MPFYCVAGHAMLSAALLLRPAFAALDDSTLDGSSLLQTHGLIGDDEQDLKLQPEANRNATQNKEKHAGDVQKAVQRQSLFSVQGSCGTNLYCVMSPNYPSDYVNSYGCTITVSAGAASLRVTDFNTESGYDYLYVNGQRYSGSSNPLASSFSVTQPIGWSADGSVTRKGWQICATPRFSVQQGSCSVSGDCVSSVNYPGNYGNSESCTIAVAAGTSVSITDFNTESGYDFLYIDGNRYAGSSNPFGFVFQVNQAIGWTTDGSVARKGWQICAQPSTPSPTESPTPSPTLFPTESPTPSPTQLPTDSPTPLPTPLPSESPTPSPTDPAPPLQPQPPSAQDFSSTRLDFVGASLTENNLGGKGPVAGSQRSMLFRGITPDGATDLLVSNLSEYLPFKSSINGFSTVNSSFAQIGLKCGSSVALEFTFLDSTTGEPKFLSNFNFTIADLDRGTHGRCQESIEVPNYAGYTLAPNSRIQVSVDQNVSNTRFIATETGDELDNPATLEGISQDQKGKSINFLFTNTESFVVRFFTNTGVNSYTEDPDVVGYAGRRLLIGGALP